MPVSKRRYDLLRQRLDVFTQMLHGVERGNPRSLHRMRQASRRLRELLPLLQLDQREARKLTRRLRRVTGQLGAVREADVLKGLLGELQTSRRYHRGLKRVEAAVAKERDSAGERLQEKLPIRQLRKLADRLDEVAGDLDAEGSAGRRDRAWRWAVEARVANRADALADAIREAGAVYLPERLHTVRIALKKFRYAVELATDMSGRDLADERLLKRAQDLLGRMHDLQMLIDRVREIQASTQDDGRAERELESIVEGVENECRRLHARYVRERPMLEAMCTRALAQPGVATPRRTGSRRSAR